MNILLPTDYYLEFCDGLEIECNDKLLMLFQLVDEALGKLVTLGHRPDGETYSQAQLLALAFSSDDSTSDDPSTLVNRNRRGNSGSASRENAAAVRAAAKACLCLAVYFFLTDEDVDALGATIRATLPFLFSLTIYKCKKVTDNGLRLLGSYLFSDAEREEDDERNEVEDTDLDDVDPNLRHLSFKGCSMLTCSSGYYMTDVLTRQKNTVMRRKRTDDNTSTTLPQLLSLELPRAAMDGSFSALSDALSQSLRSAPVGVSEHLRLLKAHVEENLHTQLPHYVHDSNEDEVAQESKTAAATVEVAPGRQLKNKNDSEGEDSVGEVSFHEMNLGEAIAAGAQRTSPSSQQSMSGGVLAVVGARAGPAATTQSRVAPLQVRNLHYDEEWIPSSDDSLGNDDEEDDTSGTPQGAVGRSSTTHSGGFALANSASQSQTTPMHHIPSQASQTPTRLAALNLRGSNMANRTIVGGSALPSAELMELFEMIEAFQPERIELKTKFMFPGPLSYFPAVHSPDPALTPPPPGPIFVPRGGQGGASTNPTTEPSTITAIREPTPTGTRAVPHPPSSSGPLASSNTPRPSMFANFFRTAQISRSNSPRSPRTPRPSPSTPLTGVREIILPRPPLTARSSSQHPTAVPSPQPPQTAVPLSSSTVTGFRRPSLRLHGAVASAPQPSAAGTRLSPMPMTSSPSNEAPLQPRPPAVPALNLSMCSPQNGEDDDGPPSTSDALLFYTLGNENRSFVDPLAYQLGRVNDAFIGSKAQLATRPLQLPKVKGTSFEHHDGLSSAMRDPSWNPNIPTRVALIEQSLAKLKLNYNVVKKERQTEEPNWMNAREYVAELLIKPTKAETLSSGTMNDEGTLLATTHYDMTCKIWRTETGELVHNLTGHTNHLSDCAWNAPFCNKLITSSFDKSLMVWDAATGARLHTLSGHELEVVCVAVSPNGKLCASGGMDDLAIIWDIDIGAARFNLLGHEGEVIALDFSPCGEKLVTGSMDETVRLWSMLDGTAIRKLEGHTAEVNQVKFNCFGNMVLSGSIDTTCRLWDVETGQSKALRGHTHEVVDCDFSPDGWTCASASDDSTIRIWDVLTGGCTMLLVGHTQGVCRIVYTPDGQSIISGSLDSTAKIWNVSNGACRQTLTGHRGLVITSYNAASQRIVTMSRDNTCRLWRLEDPQDTLAGMAALAIARSAETYADIAERKPVPATLMRMLDGFFKKLHANDKNKLAEVVGGGASGSNRQCASVPHIPSSAEGDANLGTIGSAANAAEGTTEEGGSAPNAGDRQGEGETEAEEEEEVTRIVNLRARSRLLNITAQDEIRVE